MAGPRARHLYLHRGGLEAEAGYRHIFAKEAELRTFLIAQSETPKERQARRDHAGKSAGETFAATLRQLDPSCSIDIVEPADDDAPTYGADHLARYDAVFLSGSPMHLYHATAETARQVAFMRAVFASGSPSFGACAGLQVATVAAGGRVRKMPDHMEAGIARRITPTEAGRDHPLLAGRPPSWDALAVHGDEVETLPPGATLLASNAVTQVQAAEIRFDRGIFWGVQYHPELAPGEVAVALRRQAEDLVESGLADARADVEVRADTMQALHRAPAKRSLRWLLGIDGELAEEDRRRREMINFIAALPAIDRRPGR